MNGTIKLGLGITCCLSLFACGGGGSSTTPVTTPAAATYTGKTTQATVTSANATSLAKVMLSNTQKGTAVKGFGATSAPKIYPIALASILVNQASLVSVSANAQPAVGVVQAVNATINGAVSGNVVLTGQTDDVTGFGTVTFVFNQFKDNAATTTNGSMTLVISASGLSFTFAKLTITEVAGDTLMDGTIAMTTVGNVDTLKMDFLASDSSGNQVNMKNFVYVATNYVDPVTASNAGLVDESVSGQVFDSVFGFVDITTTTPVTYAKPADLNPSGGGPVIFTGAGGTKLKLTPVDSLNVLVEADTTGDGVYDFSQNSLWSAL